MHELLLCVICGFSAGLFGGYLGLGGGVIIVPFLTVLVGLDIKVAVPVSVMAIVVNSLAASNEYLKKGLVDLELVVVLSIFSVLGNIIGSNLIGVVPGAAIRLVLSGVLVYGAFSLLRARTAQQPVTWHDDRRKYVLICVVVAFLAGVVGALVGIGGGVIMVPLMYLALGLPLGTARGTSTLMVGFSSAAATAVYFLDSRVNLSVAAPVVVGIILGGRVGGLLGTAAKPRAVKLLLIAVLVYLAYRLSYDALAGV
jgi:uncharacterized membrane protein YfcA